MASPPVRSRSSAAGAERACRSTRTPIPKPLVEIGGRPIVWHVMRLYASAGLPPLRAAAPATWASRSRPSSRASDWPGGATVDVRRHRGSTRRPAGACAARRRRARRRHRSALTYADGVADVDLAALLAFHRAHGGAGDDDASCGPSCQFGVAELDGGRPGHAASTRSRAPSTGSTAASSSSSPARSARSGRDNVLEREPLERPGRRRPAARLPPRGLLGLHGHLQGRGAAERPVGARARAPWRDCWCAMSRSRLRHRRLRAARLVADARRCSTRGARVVVLRRDDAPALGAGARGHRGALHRGPRRPARRAS